MIARIKCLGNMGRFGNQMFQYAFMKAWCYKNHYTIQTPKEWIGRKIWKEAFFDDYIKDDHNQYQQLQYDEIPTSTNYNFDFEGNFEKSDHLSFYTRSFVRNLFRLNYHLSPYFESDTCGDYVAVHVRRGDYFLVNDQVLDGSRDKKEGYSIISYNSYKSLLDELKPDCEVRWIMEPGVSFEEKRWEGQYMYDDLMTLLEDFYCLVNSKILIRSNSTFSVWAGILHQGEKVYSPVVGEPGLVDCKFVEGNHERIRLSGDKFLLGGYG